MKTTKIIGALVCAGALACGADTTATIDFSVPSGRINKWLHCSGYGPRSYPRSLENDDKDLAALHLTAARTHDWALINDGQRIVDTQYLFRSTSSPSSTSTRPTRATTCSSRPTTCLSSRRTSA